MKMYDSEFYADMQILSATSAKEIIPLLINRYKPISVVDVGCGTGAFAQEFIQNGVEDVVGYEVNGCGKLKHFCKKTSIFLLILQMKWARQEFMICVYV